MKDLQELSKKTGLSIDTLRLIKARESAFKQNTSVLNKTIQDEDSQKKIQSFKKLSDAVKSFMSFKNITSVQMG